MAEISRQRGRRGSRIEVDGTVARIHMQFRGQPVVAVIDAEDAARAAGYTWRPAPHRSPGVYYILAKAPKRTTLLLHRFLVCAPPGWGVDHRDHDTLNNRRANLRLCSRSQNAANSRARGGSSRYKGVYRHRTRWEAGIRLAGEHHYLGTFATEEEAARAYDEAARRFYGEFALLNFPEGQAVQ